MRVQKFPVVAHVSQEMLEAAADLQAGIARWMATSPEEREAWAEEARQERIRKRAQAELRPVTLEAVLDKLGWSPEYAEHYVQPYCECGDGRDGWEYCEHARDEGVR